MSDTFPDYIGASFAINLAERTDRCRSMLREFSKVHWSNDIEIFPACKFEDAAGFTLASWRGCFYSHLNCLHIARQRNSRGVLIMEDDIGLSAEIPRLMPSIISSIERLPWDMLYLGHQRTGIHEKASKQTKAINFEKFSGEIIGTHFYVIKPRIMDRLISHLERNAATIPHDGLYGPMPVDGAYNTFRKYNPDVGTYLANPLLGWQKSSRSDITPKRFDQTPGLRLLVQCLRNIKNMIGDTLER